jgi:adenylate cyclase
MSVDHAEGRLRFGPFELDVSSRELWTGSRCVRLQEQPFVILQMLLERRGRVVTRDELGARLWPAGTFVDFEHSLNAAIKRLRSVLGDDADNPRYVETVPRRGYRFIGDRDDEDAREVASDVRGRDSSDPAGTAMPADSLAVLPFADLSPDKDQEYFCDGLADELINALTAIRGLRVASRTSSFLLRGAAADVRQIGERLGVRVVLEGSVRRSGDRLRVTIQLTDVRTGFTLSSERYDRALTDVLEIQDDIAQRVVQVLEVRLSDAEKRILERRAMASPRAYDLYLQARGLRHQVRLETLLKARDMFVEAVAVEPSFALAHAALADVCSFLFQWRGRRPEHLTEALSASGRALELRPELAEVHAARGQALALSGDMDTAEREFRVAIDMNPQLFEPHYAYARVCLEQGRLADAARLFARAASLRPEDYQSRALLGLAYDGLGQADRARESHETTVAVGMRHVERYPADVRAVYMTGASLIRLGEIDRGLEWVNRAAKLDPDDGGTLYNIACAYAQAGQPDLALDTLERAIGQGITNLAWIANDPDWNTLRDTPRFQALLSRLR